MEAFLHLLQVIHIKCSKVCNCISQILRLIVATRTSSSTPEEEGEEKKKKKNKFKRVASVSELSASPRHRFRFPHPLDERDLVLIKRRDQYFAIDAVCYRTPFALSIVWLNFHRAPPPHFFLQTLEVRLLMGTLRILMGGHASFVLGTSINSSF